MKYQIETIKKGIAMHKILVSLVLALLVAGPVAASDKTDIIAVVHQFADGINKGDVKSAVATCAEQTSIIDDFAPHEWHGSGACAKWWSDFDASDKAAGITEVLVTLGKARHVDITGDRAYVVNPASLTYKEKGKAIRQTGSVWTVALHKDASGWHITGWAWSDGVDAAVPAAPAT
jgi:ketosteroid isomerase-like protein